MRNIFRKSNTKSKIINREELLEVIDSNGLYGVEIENSSKEDTQNQLFMKSKKLEDIFKFANENDIHTIFFGVRIDIWTHFMRECIINYVH